MIPFTTPVGSTVPGPRRTAFSLTALGLTIALTATGCTVFGGGDDAADDETFRIGVTAQDETNQLLADIAAEELGYDVEIVNFDDYNVPNTALSNGDLDANWFQHIAYLANYNVNNDDDLTMIGGTEIVPLSLYSETYDSVEDFQDGDTVAIANDEINQARGINVLVAAGLVVLENDVPEPRPADIDEDASTVSVHPVDAAQTVNALQSVEGSVINNSFINDAGIDPNTALFADDPEDPEAFPYINGFVVRDEDRDNEALREIAALYHDQRVLDSAAEISEDTSVPADPSIEELEAGLQEYEDFLRGDATDAEDAETDEDEDE
ncbi:MULTISPECIES: MetQ/NlpA family ABC transporter substrate-binding protein [Actinomycetes]|uniref:MetQ/NlpA family ABC transporter substrate-binding protein n=2 Tax=Actinomycetes TaxID=1760 RepID=A0ABP6M0T0_9MICC